MMFSFTHSAIKMLHCHILYSLVGDIAKKAKEMLIARSQK